MKRLLVASIMLLLSITAFANERFVCSHGDQQRVIEVVYLSDGPLPCEVTYDKGMGAEVLWSAQNTEGYCESHAKEFVEKQEGWGWTCTRYQDDTME
jgi:hypothetical protein